MDFLSVSEAARVLGARPKTISDLFYQRVFSDKICPVVGGRRLIPQAYLSEMRRQLAARGDIDAAPDASAKHD